MCKLISAINEHKITNSVNNSKQHVHKIFLKVQAYIVNVLI